MGLVMACFRFSLYNCFNFLFKNFRLTRCFCSSFTHLVKIEKVRVRLRRNVKVLLSITGIRSRKLSFASPVQTNTTAQESPTQRGLLDSSQLTLLFSFSCLG